MTFCEGKKADIRKALSGLSELKAKTLKELPFWVPKITTILNASQKVFYHAVSSKDEVRNDLIKCIKDLGIREYGHGPTTKSTRLFGQLYAQWFPSTKYPSLRIGVQISGSVDLNTPCPEDKL
jgi:hypothetical protein